MDIKDLINDAESKGYTVLVIGAEPSRQFIERIFGLNEKPHIIVIDDIDLLLKDKNLRDEINQELFKTPIPIKLNNYRDEELLITPKFHGCNSNKKPWESQRRIKKLKKK